MQTIKDFENFLIKLDKEIQEHPNDRSSIIRKAIKKTQCPYLNRKISIRYGI